MRKLTILLLVLSTAYLSGCAHPLVITPDIDSSQVKDKPIQKKVAYSISKNLLDTLVTTGGGGGDKVEYYPYRDMDVAFYNMLSKVFLDVKKLSLSDEKVLIKNNGYSYFITPVIKTYSSSPSLFTWPPTQFQVILTCNIEDFEGNKIVSLTSRGQGKAEHYEFERDFSLSGKRAAKDALDKMMVLLSELEMLK